MTPEKRDVLDEIVVKIRSGRITRRTFLERAATIGLSSTAAVSLREACGGNGSSVNLVWQTEKDSTKPFSLSGAHRHLQFDCWASEGYPRHLAAGAS